MHPVFPYEIKFINGLCTIESANAVKVMHFKGSSVISNIDYTKKLLTKDQLMAMNQLKSAQQYSGIISYDLINKFIKANVSFKNTLSIGEYIIAIRDTTTNTKRFIGKNIFLIPNGLWNITELRTGRQEIADVKMGKFHGNVRIYVNGRILSNFNYYMDVPHGNQKQYNPNTDYLRYNRNCFMNTFHGESTTYTDGGIRFSTNFYIMGKVYRQITYYPNGVIKSDEYKKGKLLHGKCKYYYMDGQLRLSEEYIDDRLYKCAKYKITGETEMNFIIKDIK